MRYITRFDGKGAKRKKKSRRRRKYPGQRTTQHVAYWEKQHLHPGRIRNQNDDGIVRARASLRLHGLARWPSSKLRYPSGKQASLGNELRALVKGEARGDGKGTLMAAYGHEYHVVEGLSEEHLLLRSQQTDD
jgi:hypothetical protein